MKVAIIGGIGSGKSEVLRVARQMGIATLSADEINAELLVSEDYVLQIEDAFPSAVKDGKVDKGELARIVFLDATARERLNAIAHPRILKRIEEDGADLLVVEMPLLSEIRAEGLFDEIVWVRTPLFTRLKRLKRRGMSVGQARLRMRAQAKSRELRRIATHTLYNGGSLDNLQRQAQRLFTLLKK